MREFSTRESLFPSFPRSKLALEKLTCLVELIQKVWHGREFTDERGRMDRTMDPESEDKSDEHNHPVHDSWSMNENEYDCDCPGPPPPDFVLPPPPAPPSAGYCENNALDADMEYCDFKVLEGSFTQTAIPSLAVIVVCSVLMLVMLLVATFLLWKHKKKMQNFLPCKTSPQNHCVRSESPCVLYEDLTRFRRPPLPNHCVPEQTMAPIEVGVPSQLKLLDVKCSNYGGAGFTPMNNKIFIYPPKDTDTLKSSKSREHFNPAYEEVSAGSEKPNGCSQDSDLESDEPPPSVMSEDEFAEDELSLVDFPKQDDDGSRDDGAEAGSGTSSLRGSTGDDLCRDLDSVGSEVEHDGHHHHHRAASHRQRKMKGEPFTDGPDARVRTVERNRQQAYGSDPKPGYYDKEVPGANKGSPPHHHQHHLHPAYEYRPPHPTEAELIEQLRQGAASGVALAPQEFVNSYPDVRRALYPSLPGSGVGYYQPDVIGPPPPLPPGRMVYTPGVYGAGELGPKDNSSPAPPLYAGRKAPPLPPPRDGDAAVGGRHLPVPLISELNQKMQHSPHVINQNGAPSSHGSSNRNSRSSSGSGSSNSGAGGARNSDPHERSLTEFSTFRPKRGGANSDSPGTFVTTLPSRRGLDPNRPPSAKSEHKLMSGESQKLLPTTNNQTPGRSRRPAPAEANSRTVIT
uniref:Uncharacterized protein n=1 Tax=Strigamia maritima TaxID=126957 RepID=T1J602_STRMM